MRRSASRFGRARVLVVQPYVPQYRKPLYDRVAATLADHDAELLVTGARVQGGTAQRGDAVWPGYSRQVDVRRLSVPRGPTFEYHRLDGLLARADLVVCPLQATLLNSFESVLRRPTLMWGHGVQSFVGRPNPVDARLEGWLLRQSAGFLAYTASGGSQAAAIGLPQDRIFVLNNTIDTAALAAAVASTSPEDVAAFRARHALADEGRVLVFLGALDPAKRLDELFAVGEALHARDDATSLLLAGDGPLRDQVTAFCDRRPWAHYVGRADDRLKGLLSAVGAVMLNPGRVGLNAVDSFVMRLPIVTTDWPFHAPEFDYLDAATSLVTDDSVEAVTEGLTDLLGDPARLAAMKDACGRAAGTFTIDAMADTFSRAVLTTVGEASGRHADTT